MFSRDANQLRIVVLLLDRGGRIIKDTVGVRFAQCALQQWFFRDFRFRQKGGGKICLSFGDEIIDRRFLKGKLETSFCEVEYLRYS